MARVKVHVTAPHESNVWRFNLLWRDSDSDVLMFDSGSGFLSVRDMERQYCKVLDGWVSVQRQETWDEYLASLTPEQKAKQRYAELTAQLEANNQLLNRLKPNT